MNKTVRYLMYVVITIICILSIIVGVSTLETRNARINNETLSKNLVEPEEIEESTTEKFKKLFTNQFEDPKVNGLTIQKMDDSKPIVYEESQTIKQDGKYSIDAHLPVINLTSEIAKKCNNETVQNFASKVSALMSTQTEMLYTIYETSFAAFLNNNVLSVAIMGSIKEGTNAQRVIIKTYNFNIVTGEEVKIGDILSKENRDIDTTAVNKKINAEVKKAAEEAESVSQTGYEVFKRNVEDTMYNVANVTNFIQGPQGELYIIYAYGNTNNTYEMDVIEV